MTSYNFAGSVALVTGGGSGIGRACCQVLAREGARVVVTDINLQSAKDTLPLLPGPQKHLAIALDVMDKSNIEEAIQSASDQCGDPPSLLVNSAGIMNAFPFVQIEEATWDEMIDLNLKGTFLVSQSFTKLLLASGKDIKGAIVNIASIAVKGAPNWSHYSASKGGVISLTKSCATELTSKGIRVNCVLPGPIITPLCVNQGEELRVNRLKLIPLGREGRPEELAEVIVFLLSERSSYMVGACVEVSGGYRL